MRRIVKVKSLEHSNVGMACNKELSEYTFQLLEKSKFDGSCLCVVLDGEEAVGIADVHPEDIEDIQPSPSKDDAHLEMLIHMLKEIYDGPLATET